LARYLPVLAVVTLAALTQVRGAATVSGRGQGPPAITYNDVAPIVDRQCASCHRPGQFAPFSLLTYADVKRHAQRVAAVTRTRAMPPWPPEPGHGEFVNERRLSNEEIDLIQRWVADGALEGDASARPKAPEWPDRWHLGRPDLVVRLPRSYTLPADGHDVFRSFVIPLPLSTARHVRGVEFRPGNPRLVHHTVIRFDRTGTARKLDDADREPGYDGMLGGGGDSPRGRFLGWTPGKTPAIEPEGMAWRLEAGTDVVVNSHLMPTDRPEAVQFEIGFFFTDAAPTQHPVMVRVGSEEIDIPAGRKDYVVTSRYMLPVDVMLISVYPHAHYLARDVRALAILPDGSERSLIWIRDWNFNWQDVYQYVRPIRLPRGTTIAMRYTYDNSSDNPRNPHRPSRDVLYGPQSSDEMADLWLQVLPRNDADAEALERDRQR
jgi:hypothetical protein